MKEPDIKNFKSEIKTILSNRIHDMYILIFKTFKFDVNLVSKYIQFCLKNQKLTTNYKIVLDGIMDSSHSDPEIYITGAQHAFNDCNDVESARRYISNGMKFHEDFKKLYIEDFWIEVKHLNQTGGSSLQTALNKYNCIIQHFKDDINLHFDLVDITLDNHIKMTQLQCIVIRDMVNQYRKNELMWQKLAKIHLKGFVYNYDTESLHKLENIKLNISIRNCINTYNEALTDGLPPENQQNLWDLFLDTIIDIYSSLDQDYKDNNVFVNKIIDVTFDKAFSINTMKQPRHFTFWAERRNNKAATVAILRKGLTISSDNAEMWLKLVQYYLGRDMFRNAMDVLTECVEIIKDKSLPLWISVELYALCSEREKVEEFYKESSIVVVNEVINLRFRPEYLEWRVLTYDIASGRKIFNVLKNLEPKSHELYKRMLQLETLSIISKGSKHIKYMRKLYSEACNLFGHMDVELWSDCIKFEYTYGLRSLVDVIFEAGVNLLENPSLKEELTKIKHELDEQHKQQEVINIEDDDE
ncbi:PREDICTED: U3 small nucleolar RNA-associated protein 6 homolog [Diuraphis noxia]|uniref:U3 small nucleolar RNA-associated protein 6 homolog n=1 Tax=Diuraphis noxia TaxID=143948 RepID=UPI00076384A8|nr:PREDICTED: U3 small nucleolar RNA-associated protein 6 homolog [Diuraphis noxia]